MKIGFLGCGKIGRALLKQVADGDLGQVCFVQDPFAEEGAIHAAAPGVPVLRAADPALYAAADLVVETATAAALSDQLELILEHSDLLMFSVTAFSDQAFEIRARELCSRYGHCIFIPHGAILGLDGIFDGRALWTQVSIETTKNPASLGREDTRRTVVFEGPTRQACKCYPRNVNVHAAVALAGIGFDRTESKIISDPAVHTNTHVIRVKGAGIDMQLQVSSFSEGGVTGKYTPYSACGSLHRILGAGGCPQFV